MLGSLTVKSWPLVYGLALMSLAHAGVATAAPEDALTEAERAVVRARLGALTLSQDTLTVASGDTAFIEARITLPTARVRGPATRYDGVMVNPKQIGSPTIQRSVDRLEFVSRGPQTEVIFVYAIVVPPGARRGGRIEARFELRERGGLGNTVARKKVRHRISVLAPRPTRVDLAADFRGHRFYMGRARQRMAALERAGVRRLSTQDGAAAAGTERLSAAGIQQLRLFERERRRAWVAHRHLVAAARARNRRVAGLGRAFLKNLAKPPEQWSGLPDLALVEAAPLEASEEKSDGRLAPVAEYRSSSEGTVADPLSPAPAPETAPEPSPRLEAPRPEVPVAAAVDEGENDVAVIYGEGLELVPTEPGDEARLGRRFYLPTVGRSLLLNDPNIAHSGAVRMSLAGVDRPEQATMTAIFYALQIGLTNDLGLEVTIPTQLVSLDVGGLAQTLYRLGNPMVAAKYRFYLPRLGRRQPVLTARLRWGIAATQRNPIPASDLFTEQFSQPVTFPDTWAFFLEKSDVGVGASLAWEQGWVVLGAESHLDYLFPTEVATDQSSFLALGFGFAAGLRPFGEIATVFAETRGVSFLAGPARTELQVYGGLRSRLFDLIEPAVWVGYPVGSAADVTGLQFGAELRFSYDVRAIVELGGQRRDPGL